MENNRRNNWSKDETILAFELYCRTPFGKIGKDNSDVIELAHLIGRTPSAVALKMHNLAHFDPVLQQRNVSAMSHASKLDQEVFVEFMDNWDESSFLAQQIRAKYKKTSIPQIVDVGDVELIPPGTYRDQVLKTRVGQNFFRLAVLSSYDYRCCITGLNQRELLIASHIKPWAASDDKTEKANPANGLCLNPLHDKAFDKGFITIDQNCNIVFSSKINDFKMDDETRDWFFSYKGKQIQIPKRFRPGKLFIEYHNDVVFLR